MMVNKLSRLFQLPSSQNFVLRIIDDLGERRSSIVLLPIDLHPDDLWQVMWDDLCRRDFSFTEVSLPDLQGNQSPASVLGDKIGVRWSSTEARTVSCLANYSSLPDIIRLRGFEELSMEARKRWIEFILQWAQSSKEIMDRGGTPASLCLLCPAWSLDNLSPEPSLYLSIRNWWGIPSALELKLMCRLTDETSLESEWRENILPSLSGNDLLLSQNLWNRVFEGPEQLINYLTEFAKKQRGWSAENLKTWGVESFQGSWGTRFNNFKLDYKHMQLWRKGILSYTTEYGVELHSAAIAILGWEDEIHHRLWRAQTPLIMPLLDNIRLEMCRKMTQRYGRDWPVRFEKPETQREYEDLLENPLACQWGYLEHLINNCNAFRKERRWLHLIQLGRFIRNELAHYRAVDYKSYLAFNNELSRVKDGFFKV